MSPQWAQPSGMHLGARGIPTVLNPLPDIRRCLMVLSDLCGIENAARGQRVSIKLWGELELA